MQQLKLSQEALLAIGFVKREVPEIEPSGNNPFGSIAKTIWEAATINGCFYYNENDDTYRWYHNTVVNGAVNFVHLDIPNTPILLTVLAAFRVKFNIVIV